MDHHGLLTLVRSLGIQLQNVRREREITHRWSYVETPVFFPESRCPYCNEVIRSPGIWFLKGDKFQFLVGVLIPREGGHPRLQQPYHPHGATPFCLGRNRDGIELLSSPVNIRDCSMALENIPHWIRQWWDHSCDYMDEYNTPWSERQ